MKNLIIFKKIMVLIFVSLSIFFFIVCSRSARYVKDKRTERGGCTSTDASHIIGKIDLYPVSKAKNAAQNAMDLLQQMAIPQIRINPIDETVTDNVGGSVAVYINFREASKEEMEGMRTADVRRVDYLEFPTDPRFHGAERVLNIIVQGICVRRLYEDNSE